MISKPNNPLVDRVMTLLVDSKLDEAQAVATSMFDLDARVRALAEVAIARLSLRQTQQALALADEVAVAASQAFAPSRCLHVLTDLLRRALDATSEPRELVGVAATVERAFFRLGAHLFKEATYASFDVQRSLELIQHLNDPQPLRPAFAALLELNIRQDAQRAVQMMHLYARDCDKLHLAPKTQADAYYGTRRATEPDIEESTLDRLMDRGHTDCVLSYLRTRLGDPAATDPSLGGCARVLGRLVTRYLAAGQFEPAVEILSALVAKRPSMTSALGHGFVPHMEALAAHDLDLALRCLAFLDGQDLQEAKLITGRSVADKAAQGDARALDRGIKTIGKEVLGQAFSRFLKEGDHVQAEHTAKRMRPPKRYECLVNLSLAKKDFSSIADAMKEWFVFEGESAPQVGEGAGQALRQALPVIEKAADWASFESVLTLGTVYKALPAETIAAGYSALVRQALAAENPKAALESWRRLVKQRESIRDDRRDWHARASHPLSSEDAEVGVEVAKWLLTGPDFEGGLEVAKDAWSRKALLEYLTAEGKKEVSARNRPAAVRLLNVAEDLAHEASDFATLAMIGNLFLRIGDLERGRTAQSEAQTLEEKRKAKEEEDLRRRMEDDDD